MLKIDKIACLMRHSNNILLQMESKFFWRHFYTNENAILLVNLSLQYFVSKLIEKNFHVFIKMHINEEDWALCLHSRNEVYFFKVCCFAFKTIIEHYLKLLIMHCEKKRTFSYVHYFLLPTRMYDFGDNFQNCIYIIIIHFEVPWIKKNQVSSGCCMFMRYQDNSKNKLRRKTKFGTEFASYGDTT